MGIFSFLADRLLAPEDQQGHQVAALFSGVGTGAVAAAAIPPVVGIAARAAVTGMASAVSGGYEVSRAALFAALPPALPSNAPNVSAQTGVGAGQGMG